MAKLSIRDLDLKGKRVFIRVDFNVPVKDGVIGDDTRICAALPTIAYALERGATVVLASHLGRPKGKPKPELTLRPVADRLSELLGRPVAFVEDSIGDAVKRTVDRVHASGGGVVLLENLRFHSEEEKNDPAFAKALASLADLYVNDAFGAAHRAHASVEAITRDVPRAAAGLLMERELQYLGHALEAPAPFGHPRGARCPTSSRSSKRSSAKWIGCSSAAQWRTFLKSRGVPIGRLSSRTTSSRRPVGSNVSPPSATSRSSAARSRRRRPRRGGGGARVLAIGDARIGDRFGVDIGPATIQLYQAAIKDAKTVVWNGPMGVFEIEAFATGTNEVARAVAAVQGTTIVGGGDSIAAVTKAGMADRITHLSTGGGASLEFLGGRTLPGVEALTDR